MSNRELNVLTDEDLVKMSREGSSTALEFLITKYKAIAKEKSKTYFIPGGDNEDVIQEGMIGIFKAIRDYDEERAASFRTFAELCITRQILTAVKSANRQKHQILNSSLSLNQQDEAGEESRVYYEKIPSGNDTDPVALILMKEIVDYLEVNDNSLFSPMENQVWSEMLKGKTYREIATTLEKSPKSVDNTIQRIKKKILGYLAT